MSNKERIGFIGVGLMGRGMAGNLVKKGWPVTVMAHRNRAPVEELMALGAAGGVVRWIGLGLTTDFYALLAFQCLHGLTFGAAHLGAMTYLQRYVPAENSATGQALYSALGMGAAMALMQPVTGWLYGAYQGGAFLAMAVLAAIGLGFATGLARRIRRAEA